MRSFLPVIAVLLPVCLQAGTVYTVTDLGLLPGGSITAASGISSNGLVVGSGDTDTAFSLPFLWTAGPGLSVVDPVNSQFAFGAGVNAAGVVVGSELNNDSGAFRAFVNDGSGATDIPILPGGANNFATAINNSGTVAGYSETTSAGGDVMAFSYSGGVLTALGTLSGGTTSQANAINTSGHIVGQSDSSASSDLHPAIWIGSGWTDLGVFSNDYLSGAATAISNADQVAGTLNAASGGGSTGFLWTASGGMTLLGALISGGDSQAYGVNSAGTVVGTSDYVAFLYSNSKMYDLNTLLDSSSTGWQLNEALAINDQGQIAGTGLYDDQQRAFLLTPLTSSDVPEPAAWLMVCGAMLLLAAGKFRLS